MKILVVALCFMLVAGAQANFWQDVGNFFKTAAQKAGQVFAATGTNLLSTLDATATKLLQAGVATGKTLLSQGIQALLLNAANALQGRRDLSTITDKLHQVETGISSMIDKGKSELQMVMTALIHGFQDVLNKLFSFAITPEAVIQKIDQLVGSHNLLADGFLRKLLDGAHKLFGSLFNTRKRSAFTDFFHNLGASLASTFGPMIQGIKNLAVSAGSAIKNIAQNLLQSTKDSISQLGDKLVPHLQTLQGHVTTIIQHGMDALNAMKDAAGDILHQTLTNMKGPLAGILNTVGKAGGTVLQHVAGAIGGATPAPTPAQ